MIPSPSNRVNLLLKGIARSEADKKRLSVLTHTPQTFEHIMKVYLVFSKLEAITARDLIRAGISQSAAYRILNLLEEQGLIVRHGLNSGGYCAKPSIVWRLV